MAWQKQKKASTKHDNKPTKKRKLAIGVLIAFFLSFLSVLIWSPAIAETSAPETTATQAYVVFDGRKLFKLARSGNLTATERADSVSSLLKQKVSDLQPRERLSVKVVQQQGWTVIRIGNRHLVTVTEQDHIPGMTVEEKAKIWCEKIQYALNIAVKERSLVYRTWAVQMSAIALTIASVIYGGLFWLSRRYRKKQLQNPTEQKGSLQLLGILLLQIGIWIVFFYYSANLFPETRSWLYHLLGVLDKTFNSEIINFGQEAISLIRLFFLILLGIAMWFVVCWASNFLKESILPLTGVEPALQDSIGLLTRYGLMFVGVLLIFNFAGIDFASLAIVLGALGIGIGFGLQNIVKDLISGLIIIFTHPIKVGELVQVGDTQGLVVRIGVRTTEISHIDRYLIVIPNSRFVEEAVKNWNRSGLTRVKVYVSVSKDSDRELVLKALLAAAQVYHPQILRHPPPKAQFRGFGDNALNFRIVVFISDPLKEPKVKSHLYDQMEIYLAKYDIKVPYPQRDIHLKVPQIDKLVANLVQIHDSPKPQLYYPEKIQPRDRSPQVQPDLEEPLIHDEYNWEAIVADMRGSEGVEIKDRRYGFKVFPKTFLGSEAVEWLMQHERATRPEAIAIGQLMVEQNIIHHVLDEHDFKDEPLFYRFYVDEEDEDTLEMTDDK